MINENILPSSQASDDTIENEVRSEDSQELPTKLVDKVNPN